MKFLFAATLLLLSVFGTNKDEIEIDFLDIIKKQMESMDAKQIHADMVEANKNYLEEMEEERKELLEYARNDLKNDKVKLEEEENDINELYEQWIAWSSVIESEEEIAKRIEDGKRMIDAFKIEKPEERDIAIKELMMEQVDSKTDRNEAEKQIDAMIKQMREFSSKFESKIKEIEEIEPTEEEEKAKEYLSSLWEKLLNRDVIEVEEDKTDGEELIKTNGAKDRLIDDKTNNLAGIRVDEIDNSILG